MLLKLDSICLLQHKQTPHNVIGLPQFEVSAHFISHPQPEHFSPMLAPAPLSLGIANNLSVRGFQPQAPYSFMQVNLVTTILLTKQLHGVTRFCCPSRFYAFRLCHTNGFYRGRMFASAYKERTLCKSRFPQCPQYTQYLQYVVPIFRLFELRDLFLSSFSTPSIHPVWPNVKRFLQKIFRGLFAPICPTSAP